MSGWCSQLVKYQEISNEMRKRIFDSFYSPDQPIPDEISLSNQFACSRMTMRKALDILVMEGILYRKRGHGTFIVKSSLQKHKVNVGSKESLGLTQLIKEKGMVVTSQIIKFEVKFPTEEIAVQLSIDGDSPVYDIIRLRMVDNEPYVLEHTYMPTHLIPGINENVLLSSVYSHINETLGLTMAGLHRKIRASKPNQYDKEYLGCLPDDPILEVEQVCYLNNGIPFEYSFSRHRYDKFEIKTVNIRR